MKLLSDSRSFLITFALLLGGCATNDPGLVGAGGGELAQALPVEHMGPEVAAGDSGPARFVSTFYEAFDRGRAMDTVTFADRYYREPASDGYNATMDYIVGELKKVGFGIDPRLELREIESEMERPAWTPRRARLSMIVPGSAERVLHGFEKVSEPDRTMLPRNAPSARFEAEVAFGLDELKEGMVLVSEQRISQRDLLKRAKRKGAVGVISASLMPFNEDPTGAERHLDAIQYRVLHGNVELPVAQISMRSYRLLVDAWDRNGTVRVAFEAEVSFDERPLRTLVATIVGDERPQQAVAMVSHLQEPGACDNATGVAGLLESARCLVGLLRDGDLEWPARTLVFVWGDEMIQSRVWLQNTERRPVAGLSSDMTGQSKARTGAIALLERMPDPGAYEVLPPDFHTPWGAMDVVPEDFRPNGLAVISRCAMADVSALVGGSWETREHPWEGGSDHDVFIAASIPAVLFWHFTDYAYHTSLDRIENVDPEELRRTAAALTATALSVADPLPADLDRYLESLKKEEWLRLRAAKVARDEPLAEMWREWCRGTRDWLRALCMGLALDR